MNSIHRLIPFILFFAFVVIARLLPHPANFTPMLALVVFAGLASRNLGLGIAYPLAAVALSDLFLGLYPGWSFVYLGYIFSVLLSWGLRKSDKALWLKGVFGALGANLIFFIVSNFGVWFSAGIYPKTFEGLVACYIAAIPFAQNTLLSTFVYGAVIVLLWQPVKSKPYLSELQLKTS
jgi:hypothetical protein